MRRTADNPDGIDPALIEANYLAVAADVPKWCADFEAARPYFGSSPGGSRGLVDWTTRMIVDTPLHILLETYRLNANADMRAELQKIQVPALIIHGDQDASAPIDLTGRKTAELIPGASLTVYPGAGHGLYASDHDTLNADLLTFIRAAALSRFSGVAASSQAPQSLGRCHPGSADGRQQPCESPDDDGCGQAARPCLGRNDDGPAFGPRVDGSGGGAFARRESRPPANRRRQRLRSVFGKPFPYLRA